METRDRFERGYRRAVLGGILLSVAAHGALFAWGRLHVRVPLDPGAELRLVSLAPDRPAESPPLEVVSLNEVPASADAGGGAARAGGGVASAPRMESVPALAVPEVVPVAERLKPVAGKDEDAESPAEAYARVADFLVETGASPKPFRPIDGRPVDVLARIGAGRGTGIGGGIGGGHCPPPRRHDLPFRRAPLATSPAVPFTHGP